MRRWYQALVAVMGLLLLSSCATGEPTVSTIPTATVPPLVIASPTAIPEPTPSPLPTATPRDFGGEIEQAAQIPQSTVISDGTGGGLPPVHIPAIPSPENILDHDAETSELIHQGSGLRNEVALTFDAGDDRGNAAEILDTLQRYGVKVSFGVTGQWAEANPDLVERMVAEGHQVFNHSWDHRSFTGESTGDGRLTAEEQRDEVIETERLVQNITGGYDTKPYFRPPYGDYDAEMLSNLAANGYTETLMWTCDTMGWNGATANEIVERCGADATAGDIILLHIGGVSADGDALPVLIETLEAQGFDLVTVQQLMN